MAAEARAALQAYLRSEPADLPRPVIVRGGHRDGAGSIRADLGASGSLVLQRGEERMRVLVGPDMESPPHLDPGAYRLIGYRIRRSDESDTPWFLSATAVSGERLEISAGKSTQLAIAPSVTVILTAQRDDRSALLSLSMRGPLASPSITIYKGGKRVPLRYEVLDAQQRVLASGDMQYG